MQQRTQQWERRILWCIESRIPEPPKSYSNENNCPIYISEKEGGDYFSRLSKRYFRAITSAEIPEIEELDSLDRDAKLQEAKKELEKI
jgi:hypothetical protein